MSDDFGSIELTSKSRQGSRGEDGRQAERGRRAGDVDMTSMVDVTFLLLIFFMVTASFQLQKSIEIPAQRSQLGKSLDPEERSRIHVQVNQHGSFFVMTPQWELETPGKQNLTTALKQAMAEADDATVLTVQVHESAKLDSLVAALDAGAGAGMTNIEVTQVAHF